VKDLRCGSQYDPVTTAGFMKIDLVVFKSVPDLKGHTHWNHMAGTPARRLIPEAKGSKERENDSKEDR
jgi:hypothetical protein